MVRKENINQHYIPQLYLKKFSDLSDFLTVYDLHRKLEYKVKPAKESYEKFYHDIHPGLFKVIFGSGDINVQFVDDFIRTAHEEKIALSLGKIEESLELMMGESQEGVNINGDEIGKLAEFIILHIIRTPDYRERLSYLCSSFCLYFKIDLARINITESILLQSVHNFLIYGLIASFENKKDILPYRYLGFFGHHIEELVGMYEQLLDSVKLVLINNSSIPFCTSNIPIIINYNPLSYAPYRILVTPISKDGIVVDLGNKNEILRLFIPISSKIGLYFFESNYANTLGYSKNCFGVIDEWNKDIAQSLNITNALRSGGKVYCSLSVKDTIEKAIIERKNIEVALRF